MTGDVARAELRALIDRYAILGDRGRADELAGLFIKKGVLRTGAWEANGRGAIVEQLSRRSDRNPALRVMRHHVTSSDIEVHDPDTASARSYFMVVTNAGLDRAGTYVDAFAVEDGRWRFARREVRIDWISPDSLLPEQPVRHPRFDRPATSPR